MSKAFLVSQKNQLFKMLTVSNILVILLTSYVFTGCANSSSPGNSDNRTFEHNPAGEPLPNLIKETQDYRLSTTSDSKSRIFEKDGKRYSIKYKALDSMTLAEFDQGVETVEKAFNILLSQNLEPISDNYEMGFVQAAIDAKWPHHAVWNSSVETVVTKLLSQFKAISKIDQDTTYIPGESLIGAPAKNLPAKSGALNEFLWMVSQFESTINLFYTEILKMDAQAKIEFYGSAITMMSKDAFMASSKDSIQSLFEAWVSRRFEFQKCYSSDKCLKFASTLNLAGTKAALNKFEPVLKSYLFRSDYKRSTDWSSVHFGFGDPGNLPGRDLFISPSMSVEDVEKKIIRSTDFYFTDVRDDKRLLFDLGFLTITSSSQADEFLAKFQAAFEIFKKAPLKLNLQFWDPTYSIEVRVLPIVAEPSLEKYVSVSAYSTLAYTLHLGLNHSQDDILRALSLLFDSSSRSIRSEDYPILIKVGEFYKQDGNRQGYTRGLSHTDFTSVVSHILNILKKFKARGLVFSQHLGSILNIEVLSPAFNSPPSPIVEITPGGVLQISRNASEEEVEKYLRTVFMLPR